MARSGYDPPMRYGICLPNFTDLASPEAIEAAAGVADSLGWEAVWTTDHVLVDHSGRAADYRINYDAIQTLAWVGARHPKLRLGTSVIVVPQRNAVVLAKELATLDALTGGRVLAGVGVGWNQKEFAQPGGGRPIPRPGRLSRRDDCPVAPSLVGLDRAVRGSVPSARGFRLQPAAGPGRVAADPGRWPSRGRPATRRPPGRRLPLIGDRRGGICQARPDHPRRRRSGRPADADALGPRPSPQRPDRRSVVHRSAAHPRRSPRKSGPSRSSASSTSRWPSPRRRPTRWSSPRNGSPRRPRSWSTDADHGRRGVLASPRDG